MLAAFAFVSYLQRINISVAAELMGPKLHLSKVRLGQIFSSFLIGYALLQIPGGLFADRYGTRLTLATSAVLWGICTVVTGLVPAPVHVRAGATSLLLWLAQSLLGGAEATTSRASTGWSPLARRRWSCSPVSCSGSRLQSPPRSLARTLPCRGEARR